MGRGQENGGREPVAPPQDASDALDRLLEHVAPRRWENERFVSYPERIDPAAARASLERTLALLSDPEVLDLVLELEQTVNDRAYDLTSPQCRDLARRVAALEHRLGLAFEDIHHAVGAIGNVWDRIQGHARMLSEATFVYGWQTSQHARRQLQLEEARRLAEELALVENQDRATFAELLSGALALPADLPLTALPLCTDSHQPLQILLNADLRPQGRLSDPVWSRWTRWLFTVGEVMHYLSQRVPPAPLFHEERVVEAGKYPCRYLISGSVRLLAADRIFIPRKLLAQRVIEHLQRPSGF